MTTAEDLCSFINASPSPFHVVATATEQLKAAGFVELTETDPWALTAGQYFTIRGGSLIAWDSRGVSDATTGFRIIGAHSDSPNLRLKEHVDLTGEGVSRLALEPYGGPILHTWFDRPLGVSGRVVSVDGTVHLVLVNEPVMTVPSLAIHLSEKTNGIEPNKQTDFNAVWGTEIGSFKDWLASRLDIDPSEIAAWDLMAHDIQGALLLGAGGEFVSSPRLDNQGTCFAGLQALLMGEESAAQHRVLVVFDHEEVGSGSERGAASPFLLSVLERIVGGSRDDFHRAIAASFLVSGDMAHGTHPNNPSRHEPAHHIALGGGPVLKVNLNLRYATDGVGAALVQRAADQAGVNLQRYVNRADLPCGTTIGPISAAATGIPTVDMGAPMLAMHSIRELMAAADLDHYIAALRALLNPVN